MYQRSMLFLLEPSLKRGESLLRTDCIQIGRKEDLLQQIEISFGLLQLESLFSIRRKYSVAFVLGSVFANNNLISWDVCFRETDKFKLNVKEVYFLQLEEVSLMF